MYKPKIGIDAQGVIFQPHSIPWRNLSQRYQEIHLMPGALAGLLFLEQIGEVHIVSQVRPEWEILTTDLLRHYGIFEKLGVDEKERLHFCRFAAEKSTICQAIGIDSFIDDHCQVLAPMQGAVDNLFLFNPSPHNRQRYLPYLEYFREVDSWLEIIEWFLQLQKQPR